MPEAISVGTAADVFAPALSWPGEAVLVFAGSIAIAVCAQLAIPLPFTPVPLSGSTFGVLAVGALLGARRGAAAAALYLIEGGMGLPFFAGGVAGWVGMFGPRGDGGYLIGFIPGAFIAGALAGKGWDRQPLKTFALMFLASSVILACGLIAYARWIPFNRLLQIGLYPFIPGDIVKSALAAGLFPAGWKWLGRRPNN